MAVAHYDLPLNELETYRPDVDEPEDFDQFWSDTLAADAAVTGECVGLDTPQPLVDTWDVTFTGHGGVPIRAWLQAPAGATGPLPVVVQFEGYSGGRGMPLANRFASAGYLSVQMDSRGQAWATTSTFSGTTDPSPDAGDYGPPGPMTRGIATPETYYYRRLVADAVRCVQFAAGHELADPGSVVVAGGSQGGFLALAAAALAPTVGVPVQAVLPEVPFLCHPRRGVQLTDSQPFSLVADYLKAAPEMEEAVWRTLSYVDGVSFAKRITCAGSFSVALADLICPPSTVYAAYNAFGGPKRITVYPYNDHEGGRDVQAWRQLLWLQELMG